MATVTRLKLGPKDHGRALPYDEFMAGEYESGYKYEIIDGSLYVSPLPNVPEERIENWLYDRLKRYSWEHPEVLNYISGKTRVFVSGRPGITVPEPDIAAYKDYPLELPFDEVRWQELRPILVVEVLTESNPNKDLVRNVELYLQVPSIKEYWILDPLESAEQPRLMVHRRHGKRWRSPLQYNYGETYTTKLLPGFELLIDPRRQAAMPADSLDLSLDYRPRLPRRKDWAIGCLGAGFIMRDCHLVAYKQAGFHPVAIASRNLATAGDVAALRGVQRVHKNYAELLADPMIEVLDIAVPPDAQPGLIRAAVEQRSHIRGILAQKPLAMSSREARELVDLCAGAGIVLSVNQNMRYDQSIRALKDILQRGWLGEPVLATIEMRAIPHWMPWSQKLHSLSTFVMSIHHLDTFRYWFGTPQRVLASTRTDPRTRFPHSDGINLYILEYDNGCRATSWDDVWAGPAREGAEGDIYIRWRVEGTDGLARGTIGWPSYPAPTPSTLDFSTRRQPGYWFQPRWKEVWFPDAFVGTMAQLLCAVEDHTEPEISGRDNLETIALCEAVFAAAHEHRVTTVQEFLG